MNQRSLGDTGYRVSEVGFGAWGIGGEMWRGVDDSEGRKALHEAVEQGITFFDTALAYGNGHSERVIGEELKHEIRSGRVTVATKVPPMNRQWPGKSSYKLGDVFPANYIATSTEQSLKNLRVEALHVQQLHVWNDAWLSDPEWEASYRQITRLKEEGKVLHWGISINDHAPETALRVLAEPVFESAQVIYNIYDRSPETALFALAKQKPLASSCASRSTKARSPGRSKRTPSFRPVTGAPSTLPAIARRRRSGGGTPWHRCWMPRSRRCRSWRCDSACRRPRCRP